MEDQSVLKWVNEIRTERGKPTLAELPRGRRISGVDCPLARALTFDDATAHVGLRAVCWYAKDDNSLCGRRRLPWGIRLFVEDFDAGRYLELVEA